MGTFKEEYVLLGEAGAYKYELRLAEKYGFSDEYKQYLREQAFTYYNSLAPKIRMKLKRSSKWQALQRALGVRP